MAGIAAGAWLLGACGGGTKTGASNSPAASGPSVTASSASGSALSASGWVDRFCTIGKDLTDQIEQRTNALQDFTPATLEEAKQSFVAYLTFVVQEFSFLGAQAKTLGPPDVPGGQAAVDSVITQITGAAAQLGTALVQAKAVPTTDETSFENGMQAIADALDRAQPFGENDDLTFGQAELDAAYSANPTCQALENSGASPSA